MSLPPANQNNVGTHSLVMSNLVDQYDYHQRPTRARAAAFVAPTTAQIRRMQALQNLWDHWPNDKWFPDGMFPDQYEVPAMVASHAASMTKICDDDDDESPPLPPISDPGSPFSQRPSPGPNPSSSSSLHVDKRLGQIHYAYRQEIEQVRADAAPQEVQRRLALLEPLFLLQEHERRVRDRQQQ
ncbi:hypothetical protein CSUB01_04607 [Colletotrichum sublineola]|uniref:Uncharacterized protein n=1 Tax=Colletotrichum sublineola TaxID=1173701 RepID=A0A066X0B1_COLSU|nr:hypothetical protein CSUB01_04607 [Colletotrichum sublineola]